ncbi:MAG: hypothetical protein OEM66_05220, partial [Acidimicrobiia bacterium]|nr:hypothetical protein [Acidimicrobiia bacterium]
QNLIQNVNRYAPSGEVEIRAEQDGSATTVTISDEGPGLAPADQATRTLGLGIGLQLAVDLARGLGGSLAPVEPLRGGASFALRIQTADGAVTKQGDRPPAPAALTPRARLFNDLSEALADRNLHRTMVGLGELARTILGSSMVSMFVGTTRGVDIFGPAATIHQTLAGATLPNPCAEPVFGDLDEEMMWLSRLGVDRAYHWQVSTAEGREACLVVGFEPGVEPDERLAQEILPSIGRIAAVALDRSDLEAGMIKERELRSAVLESLPLAISVFEGDPPVLIDMNQKEREMLGIDDKESRATGLEASQEQFMVRFADGTPLTIDNAPVAEAVRTGRSQGPFFLVVRRADGSEVFTRTHCAPYFDDAGIVAGAVVTSEVIDPADLP